jgi:hypothetical protein
MGGHGNVPFLVGVGEATTVISQSSGLNHPFRSDEQLGHVRCYTIMNDRSLVIFEKVAGLGIRRKSACRD